ncbi:MAG: hypothetical protein RMM17_08585 [Acidobacteriota bacterium]|nr:hypothetical protein [Blastocatellia bacterium]MDW8412724.1 hypothetical protein [Acidobacteriota bacterium]
MEILLSGGGYGTLPKAINLAIFLAFMIFILRKPMADFFNSRRASIKDELRRALEEKEAAEAKLRLVEDKLLFLNEEIERMRAEAEREAAAEYERLIKQAEEEAERIRLAARREIESAVKLAKQQLREFAAEKSIELASAILTKELRPRDDDRLLDEFAKELEGVQK